MDMIFPPDATSWDLPPAAPEQPPLPQEFPASDFDRVTRLSSRLLHAPVSLIAIIREDRLLLKSCVGLASRTVAAPELLMAQLCCHEVIASKRLTVVVDARQDPRFRKALIAADLQLVAWLGLPLEAFGGKTVGCLCVGGPEGRVWTEEEVALLGDLAALAHDPVKLHLASHGEECRGGEAEEEDRDESALLRNSSQACFVIDREWWLT